MNHTELLQSVNARLRAAINAKDGAAIDTLYDEASCINLEACSNEVFEEYDALVTKGNDILIK